MGYPLDGPAHFCVDKILLLKYTRTAFSTCNSILYHFVQDATTSGIVPRVTYEEF